MAVDQVNVADEMEAFYRQLESKGMDALWRQHLRPRGPGYEPYRWRWRDVEPFTDRATQLVRPGPDAERRVILLRNPTLPNSGGATHTLTAAVQTVLPGEIAPSHRHTAAAIRFIIQGKGTVTMVDGEPCEMNVGDLVLTPGWAWHGHINQGDGPMKWMDSLDAPAIQMLKAMRQEPYPDELNPATKPIGDSFARYGAGFLRPVWETPSPTPISPLLTYPWTKTEPALEQLAKFDASPFDDVAMEYTNPATGGHVLPTMACWIQKLRPGIHTKAHRHSTSQVYYVLRGRGSTIIDGAELKWEQGDFFALPPWMWHEHVNASASDDAVLFSTTDTPIYKAMNVYFHEPYTERDGHQQVTATYEERFGHE